MFFKPSNERICPLLAIHLRGDLVTAWERVLNYAVSTSQKTWDKKTKKTISELMVLNQGNRIFKNFISHQ